ncbi:hypothetical protein [Yersinia enterocolitica]|uniref:Uncharacterized protein n=1 Tax=Yersinia enterocolitica TaxID=630 RepID=A0AAD2V451_YEREN|nr:hypothetical protein [Yersinia enterocolitica]EKN3715424.1 hypothetical protein [Yersinia enterocolitica]EKN5074384.1 hypothetical protein [Yersinia enterocolitica]EKN6209111.1 hypothetical protein [Yersinia enterocolitica]ELI8104580.1 hypothetical protein [Yersinia enterocolitica]ELI8237648.1 hypothetical protein [Yersinia enterocolitica]
MSEVKIKKSEKYIDVYADFASFAPASVIDNSLINIHFITNRTAPAVLDQQTKPGEEGKANLQIGSITELVHECSVLMNIQQLKLLRANIDSLLEQLSPIKNSGQ